MGNLRILRMIRELRADPSTQFFEPMLCGTGFARPEELIGAQPPAAALSTYARARKPASAAAELEDELPLAS